MSTRNRRAAAVAATQKMAAASTNDDRSNDSTTKSTSKTSSSSRSSSRKPATTKESPKAAASSSTRKPRQASSKKAAAVPATKEVEIITTTTTKSGRKVTSRSMTTVPSGDSRSTKATAPSPKKSATPAKMKKSTSTTKKPTTKRVTAKQSIQSDENTIEIPEDFDEDETVQKTTSRRKAKTSSTSKSHTKASSETSTTNKRAPRSTTKKPAEPVSVSASTRPTRATRAKRVLYRDEEEENEVKDSVDSEIPVDEPLKKSKTVRFESEKEEEKVDDGSEEKVEASKSSIEENVKEEIAKVSETILDKIEEIVGEKESKTETRKESPTVELPKDDDSSVDSTALPDITAKSDSVVVLEIEEVDEELKEQELKDSTSQVPTVEPEEESYCVEEPEESVDSGSEAKSNIDVVDSASSLEAPMEDIISTDDDNELTVPNAQEEEPKKDDTDPVVVSEESKNIPVVMVSDSLDNNRSIDLNGGQDAEKKEKKAEEPMETQSVPDSVNIDNDKLLSTKETEASHSLKRKLDGSMASSVAIAVPSSAAETKRQRMDYELLCGDLFTLGDQLAGEMGPREINFRNVRVRKCEPARVRLNQNRDDDCPLKVRQVVCGAYHTLVLTDDGTVISFGCNDDASLGRSVSKPIVSSTNGDNGDEQNEDEEDDECGSDIDEYEEKMAAKPMPLTELSDEVVVKVSTGDMHGAALTQTGKVYIWGNFKDESNKIGLFPDDKQHFDDRLPTRLPRLVEIGDNVRVVDIASGCHHFLMLTDKGQVYSFGEGSKGQLGRIDSADLARIKQNCELFLKPGLVPFPPNAGKIVKIFASHWFSYALSEQGQLFAWGLNNYYQLGFRTESPIEISLNESMNGAMTNMAAELFPVLVPISQKSNDEKFENLLPDNAKLIKVANGQQHQLLLDSEGNVYSCGSALYGKLGHGKEFIDQLGSESDKCADRPKRLPSDVFSNDRIVDICCGDFCSMAISESGKLYSWGQGSLHIGTNSEQDRFVPEIVGGPFSDCTRFVRVSSGPQFAAAIGIVRPSSQQQPLSS